MEKVKIFISYAHDDRSDCNALKKHLTYIKNKIDIFYDEMIPAGEKWKHTILKEIHNSNVIILLLSSSFNASDFINEIELLEALKKHEEGTTQIIPIMVSEVNLLPALEPLQHLKNPDGIAINSCSDKEAAWAHVAREIEKEVELWRQKIIVQNSYINAIRNKQMIISLKDKLKKAKGFDLCSRSGIGWNRDLQLITLNFFDTYESDDIEERKNVIMENSRLLFLDPESKFFRLDTNLNWNAKSTYNTDNNPEKKKATVVELYNELTKKGFTVKITDSILPPPFWIICNKENNESYYTLVEIPVWNKQYGGNLFFLAEKDKDNSLSSYQKIFNALWDNAIEWRDHKLYENRCLETEKIIEILSDSETEQDNKKICKEHNINEATFQYWKSKYGNMIHELIKLMNEDKDLNQLFIKNNHQGSADDKRQ